MAFNVWFIIWPTQQKILSLVEADRRGEGRGGAKPALYASRFNTMFSIGMLYCMVAQQNAHRSDQRPRSHTGTGPAGPRFFFLRLSAIQRGGT